MSQQAPSVFTARCEVCMGRSTWDFLHEFYLRVETAENYARRLEKDLHEVQTTAYQCQATLAQCESSLNASWEIFYEERRNHRASRETLTFEIEKQHKTIELLERIVKEATRSGEVANVLSSRATEITMPNLAICQANLDGFLTETAPNLAERGMYTSVGQQNKPTQQLLLLSPAPGHHQMGEQENQSATRISSAETTYNRSLSSTPRTQNVSECTGSVQVTERRKVTQKGVRESPLRRKRSGPTE